MEGFFEIAVHLLELIKSKKMSHDVLLVAVIIASLSGQIAFILATIYFFSQAIMIVGIIFSAVSLVWFLLCIVFLYKTIKGKR